MSRLVDPTAVVVRHVRRPRAGETASTTVLGVGFVAAAGAELEQGLNGPGGWQSGQIVAALSDDGSGTITLPNVQGDDGVLHRERFALLTDPYYRIGEEWLEVYREPMSPANLLAVITPKTWKIDRGNLELSGPDVTGLFTLARSSELDLWHHAPRDVFDFYTRLPTAPLAADLSPWTVAGVSGTHLGFTYLDVAGPGPGGGPQLAQAVHPDAPRLERDVTGVDPYAWEVSVRARADEVTFGAGGYLPALTVRVGDGVSDFTAYSLSMLSNGDVTLSTDSPANGLWRTRSRIDATQLPGDMSMRILCRGEWLYGFVRGELVVRGRRLSNRAPNHVTFQAGQGKTTVQRFDVLSVTPFGLRGADKGDYRLPGVPPAGGVRGRYWLEAATRAQTDVGGVDDEGAFLYAALDPLVEPTTERLETELRIDDGEEPAAVHPTSRAYSARYTGAIYLDLSGNGRRLRLASVDDGARLYIGKTMFGDALIDAWTWGAKFDLRTPNLNTLGPSGWYPIVLEFANVGGAGGFVVEESALDGSGNPISWTAIPATKLSPLGIFDEEVRLESHREMLGNLTEAFGYQWRVEPRTLESGEFPGQLPPRVRVGVDTDHRLETDGTVEVSAEGDAGDAVDRLLIDAAGIADPKGSGQLTADVANPATIGGHLFVSTAYESLSEVTEETQLRTRADSMIALRAGPNEQVAVRPAELPAGRLVDTFPLTGALARLRWRPGDGLFLSQPELGVEDASPRQLLAVTLPLYRDGLGAPVVGWRQRARGIRPFLKRALRLAVTPQRNFQGTFTTVLGSIGSSPVGAGADAFSRLPLPRDLADLVELELAVYGLSVPGSGWRIEVGGVDTTRSADVVDLYDVNAYRDRSTGSVIYARLIGGAGTYEIQLRGRVRIR